MLAALLLLLTACPAGSQTRMEPPPPPPGGGGSTVEPGPGPGPDPDRGSAAEPPRDGPKLGQPCGSAGLCGEGACVTYYGIAGPRGGEFTSCEIKCDAQGGCPKGLQCITIADGPGTVCRAPDPVY
ncbi:MAG TPA: hypothetical protein VK932_31315 [Kofleriaceae bacterium]|nr:hypothetical protein [Kofleriaceae bacterium]